MKPKDRIIVALDTSSFEHAQELIIELRDHVGKFKVGLQLIGTCLMYGWSLADLGLKTRQLMLDLKLHDIPSTMVGGMDPLRDEKSIWGFTVHASAGRQGLWDAAAAAEAANVKAIAVTVLTSHNEQACQHIFGCSTLDKVLAFTRDAEESGCTAIVCSPLEVRGVRMNLGDPKRMTLVCPASRPIWAPKNDQARVLTPKEAVEEGADYLVIGRPITEAPEDMTPVEAAKRIADEIEELESQ